MATEPIKLLDSLVREAILTPYDFARLTFAGFSIPFRVKGRHSFLGAFSTLKRLSSLTYLTLWVLLAVSTGLLTDVTLAARLAGLEKQSDATAAGTIVSSLLITMIIDLLLRTAFLSVQPRIRREMYLTLARVAIGNFFLGALVIILFSGSHRILPPVFALVKQISQSLPWLLYPNIFLFLFSPPLALILVKAFASKNGWVLRLAVGVLAFLLAPVCTLYAAIAGVYLGLQLENWVSPHQELVVKQQRVQCAFKPGSIRITGFLTLTGADQVVIRTEDIAVIYTSADNGSVRAELAPGQPGLVLSNSKYTWIDLVGVYYEKSDPGHVGRNNLECSLLLTKQLSISDDAAVQVDDGSQSDAESGQKDRATPPQQ